MVEVDEAIKQARGFLLANDPKKALSILKPFIKSPPASDIQAIQLYEVLSEVHLENLNMEKAYSTLLKACEADLQGELGSPEKFFTLGQITGGFDGINIIMKGIESINRKKGSALGQDQAEKIVSALLAMIEIWMTDLCMEPNAEQECEQLVTKALEVSEHTSHEAWAILGSIRISQLKYNDAIAALTKAWEFLSQKKDAIEASLKGHVSSVNVKEHTEYTALLQPMLSLAKMCIETGLYEHALQILTSTKDIDEDNLESLYLEGFTNYLMVKLQQFKASNPSSEITTEKIPELNQYLQELPLDLSAEGVQDYIYEARVALSFAAKIGENCDPDDEISQELVQGVTTLLQELGGTIETSELMKIKMGDDVNEQDESELNELCD